MKKFLNGFYFAGKGISYSFSTQLNFRIHCLIALFVIGAGFYLQLKTAEWLWIIAAMALVFIAELFNTAIETLVDLVSPEFNPQAGRIKDISAAAVLIAAIMALLTGVLIFLPKIIDAA
jgi:diacylglycerol kinase